MGTTAARLAQVSKGLNEQATCLTCLIEKRQNVCALGLPQCRLLSLRVSPRKG